MTDAPLPRFRFAPSPTGMAHVGSLHTALFNWALARSMRGDFVLRIDDTDAQRNEGRHVQDMIESLHWLGIEWDEGPDVGGDAGPYIQSQRRARHLEIAELLYKQGAAYYADADDTVAGAPGAPLRLRMPAEGEITVEDALRGAIHFDSALFTDPVIVRSDGSPLYHLATVVDDHDMAITHVARGEEWIPSTPIQLHIYRQLGWQPPVWIHLPLILNRDGKKLSKRDEQGAYLVSDLQAQGYLPDAVFNYLLLLGWSPPGERELLRKADVRSLLRLEDLSTSPAMFDWEKLNWLNRHYLQQLSERQLAQMARPFLEDAYPGAPFDDRWLQRLVSLLRDDLVRLSDVVHAGEWALADDFQFSAAATEALQSDSARPTLVHFVAAVAQLVLLDEGTAQSILSNLHAHFTAAEGWSARDVYWPIRAALTGHVRGPALHEIMALLGKDTCLRRVAAILRAG